MYIGRSFKISFLLFFAWRKLAVIFALPLVVFLLHDWLDFTFIRIPFGVVSTVGVAVAFYVGFKNNQSYGRLWEARQIWGAITNTSRNFACLVMANIGKNAPTTADEARKTHRELIFRHLAWINVLRLQLRRPLYWNGTEKDAMPHIEFVSMTQEVEVFDHDVEDYLRTFTTEEEYYDDKGKGNIANMLLKKQSERLAALRASEWIDPFIYPQLTEQISKMFDQQGASERLKTYPLPRQYSIFSHIFVHIFIYLLPFALVSETTKLGPYVSWLLVPLCAIIGWLYYTMEQVGDASENPFENAVNDIPLSAICRNIEIDLRELLGETNLPPKLKPVDDVLL
jgi:putative membrane protein